MLVLDISQFGSTPAVVIVFGATLAAKAAKELLGMVVVFLLVFSPFP